MRNKRERFTVGIPSWQSIISAGCLIVMLSVFTIGAKEVEVKTMRVEEDTTEEHTATYIPTPTQIVINDPDHVTTLEADYKDPNNYIYPYNTMSVDWRMELYEQGFSYYEIPEKYAKEGGCFPEVVQVYLWCQCKQRDIDYYIAVALIERESSYFYNASGDNGASKGYMQVQERLHKERMEAESVVDLYNPYDNIRVGLNLLQELKSRSNEDWHYVLMSYNMGESRCKELNTEGIYSSEYSAGILQRAQEIKQELIEQD